MDVHAVQPWGMVVRERHRRGRSAADHPLDHSQERWPCAISPLGFDTKSFRKFQMTGIARFALLTCWIACLTTGPAFAQEPAPSVPDAIQSCSEDGFRIVGAVVCLKTTITTVIADEIMAHEGAIYAVVLDTPGGDMAASLRIGRRMFADKAQIIVDGECSSSCANYLAPLGHRKLHVTEGSFIAIHGVPPRDLFGFIDARRIAAGKSVEEAVADPTLFFSWQNEYPEHVRTVVLPEVQYFADVQKNEAYATRFAEVMRTISMRSDYPCALTGPALLIVGPQVMRQFRVNSENVWWDADRRAFIDRLPADLREYALIIDGDEHPSWLPGRGFVTPTDCASSAAPISDADS